ncbi:ATP-binding cassette domain-containing protein [Candidatus Bathyarchaeota archaeon]|jgi:ABC-type Fe3+/spermidine/putrescine transport system ATPase subunit|nr:ATP-binding cassette domain-containing protein [Candidatus Bathyarchaeota archaeon]
MNKGYTRSDDMGGRLVLRNVSKDFNGFKLVDVNLTVNPGEYHVLIGPTGSGKTLLLETINGFHRIDSGSVEFNGRDITDLPPNKRSIGYVPQTPNLNLNQSVRQNLEYTIRLRDLPGSWENEIEGILDLMNLKDYSERPTISLSGGEKRKAALARALILKPDLLLLDEPLSSLDITSKVNLRDEIRMIHKYLDITVIHVTHDQQEALGLADELGIMRRGTIVSSGTVEQVYSNPVDLYAARFLGYENIFDVSYVDSGQKITKLATEGIVIRTTKDWDGEKKVGIHGDDVIISKVTPDAIQNNIFQGRISDTMNIGPSVTVKISIGPEMVISMSKRRFWELGLDIGENIWVQFPPESVKPLKE